MYRLLIVEDDFSIANELKAWVEKWDMEAAVAENFREVTTEYARFLPHIILLDITLPFYDGYYWCREIRKISNVPIVFLSSAADNMNVIMAMNLGADDFVAKPFDRNVLMAKIQALLRRSYDFAGTVPVLEHRGAFLNMGDNTLTFGEEKLLLTYNEYRILLCLMENKGSVVSREKLMERLWETEQFVDENTLTVNVNRLRKKLDAAGLEHFIQTKFGVGYLLE